MGIFANSVNGLWAIYQVELKMRNQLRGGVPKDPKIIEGWLRSKAGISDSFEVKQATLRTLQELGVDIPADATFDDMVKASEEIANQKQAVGFKRGEHGLYLEARCVKAMLKEATNIVFEADSWGKRAHKTKEGAMTAGKRPKAYLAERVFVDPDKIWLGVNEPTGVELFIGHVMGPKGPQSSLAYYEYVEAPTLTFQVKVLNNDIKEEHWPMIWEFAQDNGLGAQRSQEFGRFDIEKWERVH